MVLGVVTVVLGSVVLGCVVLEESTEVVVLELPVTATGEAVWKAPAPYAPKTPAITATNAAVETMAQRQRRTGCRCAWPESRPAGPGDALARVAGRPNRVPWRPERPPSDPARKAHEQGPRTSHRAASGGPASGLVLRTKGSKRRGESRCPWPPSVSC